MRKTRLFLPLALFLAACLVAGYDRALKWPGFAVAVVSGVTLLYFSYPPGGRHHGGPS